jgi:hypothetical protein
MTMAVEPLDGFANSPRRFRNNDGSEVVSSSLTKLGPGLIASRPATQQPGETTYVTLDVSNVQQLVITALELRVATLEAGGRWTMPSIYVFSVGPDTLAATLGSFQRIDASLGGGGDVLTVTLPAATADDVGRSIGISEISGALIGPANPEIRITTTGGQAIDNRAVPIELTGTFPKITFTACLISSGPDVYGWTVASNSSG